MTFTDYRLPTPVFRSLLTSPVLSAGEVTWSLVVDFCRLRTTYYGLPDFLSSRLSDFPSSMLEMPPTLRSGLTASFLSMMFHLTLDYQLPTFRLWSFRLWSFRLITHPGLKATPPKRGETTSTDYGLPTPDFRTSGLPDFRSFYAFLTIIIYYL